MLLEYDSGVEMIPTPRISEFKISFTTSQQCYLKNIFYPFPWWKKEKIKRKNLIRHVWHGGINITEY